MGNVRVDVINIAHFPEAGHMDITSPYMVVECEHMWGGD